MTINKGFIILMTSILIQACAVDKSGQSFSFPSSDIPVAPPASGSDTFPTSASGGYFRIMSVVSEVIPSGKSIIGFSSDSSALYRNLGTFDGGGLITGWQIQSLQSSSSSWTNTCTQASGGLYQRGLAVDGTNYYIVTSTNNSSSSSTQLKKIAKTNCADQGVLDLGEYIVYDSDNAFKLSWVGGNFYFAPTFNPWRFRVYDSLLTSTSSLSVDQSYQGTSLTLPSAVLATSTAIWAVSRQRIWKLNTSGAIVAWAELPESQYSALVYPTGLAIDPQGYLVLLTQQGTSTSRFSLDISHFN